MSPSFDPHEPWIDPRITSLAQFGHNVTFVAVGRTVGLWRELDVKQFQTVSCAWCTFADTSLRTY